MHTIIPPADNVSFYFQAKLFHVPILPRYLITIIVLSLFVVLILLQTSVIGSDRLFWCNSCCDWLWQALLMQQLLRLALTDSFDATAAVIGFHKPFWCYNDCDCNIECDWLLGTNWCICDWLEKNEHFHWHFETYSQYFQKLISF